MAALARDPFTEDDDEEEEIDDLAAYQRQYEDDHSWEELQEDEFGRLLALDTREEQRAKRKRLLSAAASARIKRGMIRYLQVIVDLSRAASIADMRPTRAGIISYVMQNFVREFFDQNPLSHLGIIALRDGLAERLTDLSGSPEAHVGKLRAALDASGDASLQNGLQMAIDSLKTIPPYGHREVLILFAAMSTCDPGDIQETIKAAKESRCRVSIIGLAAEVHICRQITEATGGTYGVAKDEKHLEELVMEHSPPPPSRAASTGASLVRMGFPHRNAEGPAAISFVGAECIAKAGGFTCPRCKARVLDLPSTCHICRLTLVSSPHLARSYHHLFPVKPFVEIPPKELRSAQGSGGRAVDEDWQEANARVWCFGCLQPLLPGERQELFEDAGVLVRCQDCKHIFCFECDSYIHESLHNCPGCECIGADEEQEDVEME